MPPLFMIMLTIFKNRLYDEVILSLQDSAQMDIKEEEMREDFRRESDKLQRELDQEEKKLIEIMKEYVKAEDEV